jgi:serine protease Do
MKRLDKRLLWGAVLALSLGLFCVNPVLADQRSRVTNVVRVVRQASPAVVKIATKSVRKQRLFNTGDEAFDRLFEEFFGPMTAREEASLGSGVIIDGKRGLIATNRHVISRATSISVHLSDRRVFQAQVLGADPESDLAVLRIDTKEPLPQADLGNSDDLMIGETIIAIGNPFGLSHTVTTGVVSALHRRVQAGRDSWLHDMVQIDASINPGNSGGPLLNVDGELVGINTAIYRQGQGIGFAVPVNRVKRVVGDLVRHGEVVPSWLGLFLQDMTPRLAAHFGLQKVSGALVLEVMDNSPAQRAGFKRGDLITHVDKTPLANSSHYQAWLGAVAPGDTVTLTVRSKKRVAKRHLEASPFPLERAQEVAWLKLGFTVRALDAETARMHRAPLRSAVVVAKVRARSEAASIGLRPGDLVRQIGDRPTRSVKEFTRQIARQRLVSRITILVRRGTRSQFITLGR